MKLPGKVPDGCEITSGALGGRLRLAGHRISMAQIVAEVAEGRSIKEWCDDMSQDVGEVSRALHGLASWLDQFDADSQ